MVSRISSTILDVMFRKAATSMNGAEITMAQTTRS
jgi:hypothetical protein